MPIVLIANRSAVVNQARGVLAEYGLIVPHGIGAVRRTDATSRWVLALKTRRGFNKAVVAMAAKQARALWALLATGLPSQPTGTCP